MAKLMNVGFGNLVNTDMILGIITPDSAPAKRMILHSKENASVIDATQGRRTKSIIMLLKEYKMVVPAQVGVIHIRIENGDVAVVKFNDDEATLKQVKVDRENKELYLTPNSNNNKHLPQIIKKLR